MRIKIVSDLHAEFYNYNKIPKILDNIIPVHTQDKETTLVLAGDTGVLQQYASTIKPVFNHLSSRFKHVVVVPGNHEYYQSTGIWGHEKEYWDDKRIPENLYYLDNDYKIIDDVMFICSCLWTSFEGDPLAAWHAGKQMNDFVQIKKYQEVYAAVRLTPEDTIERHHESVKFISAAMHIANAMNLKPVVVTHHAPSYESVHQRYQGELLNHAFYTNLEGLIEANNIALWCHGHMHNNSDYELYGTRVICNPFGYKDVEKNVKFDGNLVVEV